MAMRAVKSGELFSTFIYDGKDCADMGVYNVTSSSTYTMNIEPKFNDQRKNVPMYDGSYYYGTQITGQQFKMNCFAHDLSAIEYNRLRAWLNPRKVGRLILSDQPYKYYLVKVASISNLSAYPLTTVQTPRYSVLGDHLQGDVVYTGNFTVTFETVGSAYGYGLAYYRDDLIYDAKHIYGNDFYYNSGLLYRDMSPKLEWDVPANTEGYDIPIYNPGSAPAQPVYQIEHTGTMASHSFIQLNNPTQGTSTVIDLSDISGNITIDTQSQVVTDEEGTEYYGRFSGTKFEVGPKQPGIEIPETFVENIEDTNLLEYDSIYIQDNVVYINPSIFTVTEDLVGQYFCICLNGGSKIMSVNTEENSLTLDPDVETYDIPPAQVEDGQVIRKAGMAFNYVEVNNVMPTEGNVGDVCVVDDVWYVYLYDEWKVTNMFGSKNNFKNGYGDYVTIYKLFGATIVPLDQVSIVTGTNINYRENGQVKQGASVDAFKLTAGLQPRYL